MLVLVLVYGVCGGVHVTVNNNVNTRTGRGDPALHNSCAKRTWLREGEGNGRYPRA